MVGTSTARANGGLDEMDRAGAAKSRPAPGGPGVRMPGQRPIFEIHWQQRDSVEIDDADWQAIRASTTKLGVMNP